MATLNVAEMEMVLSYQAGSTPISISYFTTGPAKEWWCALWEMKST